MTTLLSYIPILLFVVGGIAAAIIVKYRIEAKQNAIYSQFKIKTSREYVKVGVFIAAMEMLRYMDKQGVFDLPQKNVSQMKNNSDYYSPEDRKKYNELYYQNNKKTLDAKNRARLKNFMRRRRTLKKVLAQVESSLKKTPMKCDEIQP